MAERRLMQNAIARKYAEGTEVSVEKSRAELETLLERHGATEFALHKDALRTTVIYRLADRMIRQHVDYPDPKLYERIDPKNQWSRRREPKVIKSMQEAEWRRRWRAAVLITKAKLELVAGGESTIEREFLADVLLPNGQTVGEAMLPRIAESYETGGMPKFLLGSG